MEGVTANELAEVVARRPKSPPPFYKLGLMKLEAIDFIDKLRTAKSEVWSTCPHCYKHLPIRPNILSDKEVDVLYRLLGLRDG